MVAHEEAPFGKDPLRADAHIKMAQKSAGNTLELLSPFQKVSGTIILIPLTEGADFSKRV